VSRKKNLLSRLLSRQRRTLLLMAAISLALGAAIAGQAGLLAEAVQRIFVENAPFQSIVGLLGALLAVMAARALLLYGNGTLGLRMAVDAKTAMRSAVLRKLSRDPLAAALAGQTGGKVSVALDAVDEADGYFSQYMPRMMEAAVIPAILLTVVFIQHSHSGFIMLATAPFIPLFMILVGLKTKTKSEEKFAQLAEFSGTFLDSLQGLVSLKLFGRAKHQRQQIEESSLGYRDATMGILRVAFTNTFMLELIVMLSIGVVALELALQLLVFKTMEFHTAFLVLLLVPEFYNLLKNMGIAFHGGRTSMGAARKVEELLGEDADELLGDAGETAGYSDARGKENMPGEAYGADGNSSLMNSHNLILMPPTIELRNAGFRYSPEGFQLEPLSLRLAPGEQLAIVGKSGSGKTTLLHLLAGLLKPAEGEVLINGVPLTESHEASWFRHVSYITQHPYIFAGTFADNIAIGAGRDVSRDEIERAAKAAGLDLLAAELEQGFDTIVGEGGRGLSGGERQRLALARAFLKGPAVILFDEPTVGLDLVTERVLQRSIAELAKKATMITVAHRLYTITQADVIAVLDNGVLLGAGRHEELVAQLPPYAEMVEMQQKGGLS
jgi:ATP-binding cassette, subfamily C, bacterial CydD